MLCHVVWWALTEVAEVLTTTIMWMMSMTRMEKLD